MNSIVDEQGNPFNPDPKTEILKHALVHLHFAADKSNLLAEQARIDELRRSCGVEPEVKTLRFRRSLPYGNADSNHSDAATPQPLEPQ